MEELKQYQVGKKGMFSWLTTIEERNEIVISLYLPAKSLPHTETNLISVSHPGFQLPDSLIRRIENSATGAALLYTSRMLYVLLPPFPLRQSITYNRCEVTPLRDLLNTDYTCALLMIRLGFFTIAVTRGETVTAVKAGTGNIHSRHRQGGSSSRRFERHRYKQIEMFFTRVCGHARETIEPYAGQIEHVILDGEDHTIREFRQKCRFIDSFAGRILDRKLDIREPRRSTLDKAIYNLWSTKIIEWPVPQNYDIK